MRLVPSSLALLTSISLITTPCLARRKWNDTGRGTIAFEESWGTPEIVGPLGGASPEALVQIRADIIDVHNQRLKKMDANGIDFMILSCVTPCIQGISSPSLAASTAKSLNNELASQISNNTLRFGALAALSMHDPVEAAQELNRTVKELGFLGALVNDYQQAGANNDTLIFYDTPQFDPFWKMVTDLDVPVYFHPRVNIPIILNLSYSHAPFLIGASQEFQATLSTHVLGLCTNGVFDRFPTLKVIVGHMGERVPSDLFRIDSRLDAQRSIGLPMKQTVRSYWHTNLYSTTSGDFDTSLLLYHKSQIGLDRIMFSVDYPFDTMEDASGWVNSLGGGKGGNGGKGGGNALTPEELLALKRKTAIKVFKLNN
ncbi:hypothetical protein D9758_011688 [Tetrapyrgos nigripes]|uniref:Amidohydrolase-related domain-containing protein n=1 Tax=Tetrapyrgos nigripes TaxID=182062 RepID=A0A8H5LMM6_9AGAR|nr:hypothetical protein D9758_011688 [Tetrapyrgos nigripes]